MTTISFFNQNPDDGPSLPTSYLEHIGSAFPLYNREDERIGEAKIVDMVITKEGVYVTYETDAALGLHIDLPLKGE